MNKRTSHLRLTLLPSLCLSWIFLVQCTAGSAGLPYHIDSAASAALAVQQYGENPTKFEYCIYQALVDNDEWRLVLAAHDALKANPGDPNRECCFVGSLAAFMSPEGWPSSSNGTEPEGGPIPPDVNSELSESQREAYSDIEDAVDKLPNSFEAHLAYGDLVQFSVLATAQQYVAMVEQYRRAEELRPRSGVIHRRLANAYWIALHPAHLYTDPAPVVRISEPPKITMQLVVQEELTAVRLLPAYSECYLDRGRKRPLPGQLPACAPATHAA